MSRRRVLVASCAEAAGLDDDEPLLLSALSAAGVDAGVADWRDPDVDWAAADLVLVRSTWDYAPHRTEFLDWASRVESVTRLANPAAVLDWNTDKRYLRELAGAGVPVVPTAWAEQADQVSGALSAWPGDVVVKPAVSAGARDTARFAPGEREAAAAHAHAVLAGGRAVLVQPYLTRLDAAGETGLVYLDGEFSHAFGKGALLAGGPLGAGLFAAEQITARTADEEQRAVGEAVLAWVLAWVMARGTQVPLYARVDVVPGEDGAPQVIELELTEPSLNLGTAPGSAQRLAAAVLARLG